MSGIILFIGAALVNNIVLSRFLGICPFVGVSKNFDTTFGMSLAVTFVMLVSSVATWIIEHALLRPWNLEYLQTVVFVLVIAALVQLVEIIMEKTAPELYAGLGIFLPLITTNCAILGVALLNVQLEYSFIEMIIFSLGTAAGFALALLLFAGLRARVADSSVPEIFKDIPIALITAGILSLAFMGFSGLI
ncbi:MAG: electron transport complex subunit RsxA [Deferribacterales bacterium]|nr:electron transport complex subunit RsxA [Deferribacterales bacterium]